MRIFFRTILTACLFLSAVFADAADSTVVKLKFDHKRITEQVVLLTIKAVVPEGLRVYALQKSDSEALYSTIEIDTAYRQYLDGTIDEKGIVQNEMDSVLGMRVSYFEDSVQWQQKLQLAATDSLIVKGRLNLMVKNGDSYLPEVTELKFYIEPAEPGRLSEKPNSVASRSILWIFLTAFAGGLLALLTPCVYSMIPVTVSYFTKRSRSRKEGISNVLTYSSSIIIIFTLLGFLITLIFGPAALNNLATNWIANLVFFVIFLIFGASFLGAFEITLPATWANKAGGKSGGGSFAGIFFMALTLVLVSFSCTGPIIGNLLVLAARGSYYGPLAGMFGFSLALALPFALFAFFPSKLNILGKAGGWLNAVKVTLGFLELALALKFLSNADLVKGWRLLDREIFISLWIVIFALLGFYLLGKLKFRHDDQLPANDFGLPFLTVTRLFFAIGAFMFAIYMIPGLWGAPLKGISAFVPPMGTQDFSVSAMNSSNSTYAGNTGNTVPPHPEKYYEQMKIYEPEVVRTYGMTTYFDYDEALGVARRLNKPLMIDFTGINCVNCRKMEGQVWSDPKIMQRLKADFVIVSLYVDVHNIELPPGEQYYSTHLQKDVETLGDKNADMQVSKFGANTQPYYFFLDGNERKLVEEGYGYDPSIEKFLELLESVKEEYRQRTQDINMEKIF